MRGKNRRKRGASVWLVLFVALALAAAFVLSSGLFFKVRDIRVEGVTVYSAQEVADLTGIMPGDNLFLISKKNARLSIMAKLPYAKGVRIKREWARGVVVVIVTEAAPVGMIENRGSYWLFDGQGTLLENAPLLTAPKLPVVKGTTLLAPLEGDRLDFPEGEKSKREPLLELLKALLDAGLWNEVDEVDISQLSNLRFTYKKTCKVVLGIPEGIGKKLRVMCETLERILESGPGTLYLGPVSEDKPAYFVRD